jgi:IstB-like ATP binding protein
MNLQQERGEAHCQSLKLEGLMQRYRASARDAAGKGLSFLDFLENVLRSRCAWQAFRPSRRSMTTATGMPKKMIDELPKLQFVERSVVFLFLYTFLA